MNGKWAFPLAAFSLAWIFGSPTVARADSPWSNLLTVNRVEADPAKNYALSEDHGPWMIMACSFNGQEAEKQARDLALELRRRYHMEAYVYQKDFKLDDPNGNVQPILASPNRHVYHIVSENPRDFGDGAIRDVAVIVGNFPAIDDPEAQRVLKALKAADPDCMNPNRKKTESHSIIDWQTLRSLATLKHDENVEARQFKGPLARTFITRNPLLPDEYFVPKTGLDELVVKMNKNVKYSLLECPGKYTVQVAHFTGEVILNQGEIRAIESGTEAGPESTKQGLAKAAEKAHELTEALRIKGWEAYEFHDRYASLVTVGSFDSVGTPRSDGKIEINPEVHRIMQVFGGEHKEIPGSDVMNPKSLVGIFFDVQPLPVEVPRRSISRQLGQRVDMAAGQ